MATRLRRDAPGPSHQDADADTPRTHVSKVAPMQQDVPPGRHALPHPRSASRRVQERDGAVAGKWRRQVSCWVSYLRPIRHMRYKAGSQLSLSPCHWRKTVAHRLFEVYAWRACITSRAGQIAAARASRHVHQFWYAPPQPFASGRGVFELHRGARCFVCNRKASKRDARITVYAPVAALHNKSQNLGELGPDCPQYTA